MASQNSDNHKPIIKISRHLEDSARELYDLLYKEPWFIGLHYRYDGSLDAPIIILFVLTEFEKEASVNKIIQTGLWKDYVVKINLCTNVENEVSQIEYNTSKNQKTYLQ